jgi:hypothetical protein
LQAWQRPARGKNPGTQPAEHLLFALGAAQPSYAPAPYTGRALILKSGRQAGKTHSTAPEVWDNLLADSEIYHGPPGRTRLFDPPLIGLAAERIRAVLNHAVDPLSDPVDQLSDATLTAR